MERDGLDAHAGRAEPDCCFGRNGQVPGRWRVPTLLVDSTGKMSVTFKEFGVGLAFTPVVMSEGRISLKIETEVSELTDAVRRHAVRHQNSSAQEASGQVHGRSCRRAARWRLQA